jgi:uncharacterized protein YhbP (UPF0306 family)
MKNNETPLRTEIALYLDSHNSMSVATSQLDRPWSAAVYYVHDTQFNLYFLSEDKSRHSRNISANCKVAVTINEDPDDWRKIRGLQMEGQASKITSTLEKVRVMGLYVKKFPFVKSFLKSPVKSMIHFVIGGKAVSFSVYKITPDKILFLDNSKGFSKRNELVIAHLV